MNRFTAASWAAGVLFGVVVGVGGFTFFYARGASYLGHDSSACANCHVMRDQYDGWIKSSHRAVAECNDCHTPPGLIPKYAVKALNGFRHSWAFTTGSFHEPIQISGLNRDVTERACRHCHADVTQAMLALSSGHGGGRGDVSCLRCHGSVGHPERSAVALAARR